MREPEGGRKGLGLLAFQVRMAGWLAGYSGQPHNSRASAAPYRFAAAAAEHILQKGGCIPN